MELSVGIKVCEKGGWWSMGMGVRAEYLDINVFFFV